MDIILWRHAEAEVQSATGHDSDRTLSKRGRKDAARMAKWLKKHLPADVLVLSSPACRCQQTASALHDVSGADVQVADFLSVESDAGRIVKELAQISGDKTVLLVGHQPTLGLLAAKLAGMPEAACAVKKGAVWWLRQRMAGGTALQTYLLTVQHPDLL